MEINFSKNPGDTGATSVVVETPAGDKIACPTTGPGGQPSTHVPAVYQDTRPALSEVILPRLNLVHSVGLLKDSFTPGSYVHNQQLTLYTPALINVKSQTIERAGTPPLTVTFLALQPVRFFENVKGGGRGLICDTEAEVRAAGGTVNYKEFKLKEAAGIKRFDYACNCLLAIERPESVVDDDTTFVFEVDGKKLALCLYNMKGSAFTVLKGSVNTAKLTGCLRGGLSTWSWSLSARTEPTPDRSSTYWKPVLVPCKKSTPAFLEFAASVLAAPKVESPETE